VACLTDPAAVAWHHRLCGQPAPTGWAGGRALDEWEPPGRRPRRSCSCGARI